MSHTISARVFAGALAAATALSVAACSSSDEASVEQSTAGSAEAGKESAKEAAFPRTIETLDGQGNAKEITIEKKPERIVSVSVTLTGALVALDAPVVGSGGGNPKAPMFDDETGFGTWWADTAKERGITSTHTAGNLDAEAVLALEPDLVIMSNVGQDKGSDIYDQLAALVPVQVVDYSDQSWEETTKEVAHATGLDDAADQIIANYEKSVADAKGKLNIEGPVNIVSLSKDTGMNFFTEESAQGRIFTDLGVELALPKDELVGKTAQGTDRGDIKGVNPENIPLALEGQSVFVLNLGGKEPAEQQVRSNPALAQAPAVANDRVYGLDGEFFRIDAISAQALVDHLVETF
ncbi:Fe2+-enterobactin ABC transporter substrate-binding protein [Corynebacterium renale]|uniref:Iron complex transport system substrate-binding protein n=1 Tax=Corynebacterium renale TaxID=1724 RepID=A0A2A9DPE9_9CORY|nr:Fe2+-enterobactin ABC transporter substrate-binding protein [Corynebacterium renale]PFG28055.1 iron complex transport system substrate-binding protein [Corynebacterium renale]SQI21131.1 iron-enterobactin transporter periplasmic binding protein [Corynebacterium renale]